MIEKRFSHVWRGKDQIKKLFKRKADVMEEYSGNAPSLGWRHGPTGYECHNKDEFVTVARQDKKLFLFKLNIRANVHKVYVWMNKINSIYSMLFSHWKFRL